jgi:hypothetical protein
MPTPQHEATLKYFRVLPPSKEWDDVPHNSLDHPSYLIIYLNMTSQDLNIEPPLEYPK